MKKLSLLFAGAVICAAGTAICAEVQAPAKAAVKTPALRWKANRGTLKFADGVYSINSQRYQGGMRAVVPKLPNRRFTLKAEIRGEGKFMLAVSGDFGWRYGNTITLTGEWRPVEISYGTVTGEASISFLSMTNAATAFEVRNVEFTVSDPAVLDADDIEGKLLPALEYAGSNARKYKAQNCVWGKRWYHLMSVPVPANSKGLYYYVHIKSANGIIKDLYLQDRGQRLTKSVACSESDGKYAWVKLGPVNAAIAPQNISVTFNGDPKLEAWVDKAVLSTNPALTAEQLEKAE